MYRRGLRQSAESQWQRWTVKAGLLHAVFSLRWREPVVFELIDPAAVENDVKPRYSFAF
jgi:hypothetical protein